MENKDLFRRIEKSITDDKKYTATLASYATILLIFVNLTTARSPIIGVISSLTFLLINGIFLGQAFFQREKPFLRPLLGSLLLIAFLGAISWIIMVIYNLDNIRSTIALFMVATISTAANRYETNRAEAEKQDPPANKSHILRSRIAKTFYLLLIALLTYLLLQARNGEIYIVWQFMHPMFIPLYFATTFLLLYIIFSSEKTQYKLLFVIIHSILSHSFFVVIFPAGDISGQQVVLGRTRLIFDNVIMDGWPPVVATNILERVFQAFRGINFQAALSVIFARMFSVDIFWIHMLLVPVLWGTFISTAVFVTTRTLGANERISILAALLFSLFPSTLTWGTYSVPNSLGYIFFALAVPFCLRYLSIGETRNTFLMIAFSAVAFLAHALTGIIAFSLAFLALAFKKYQDEKPNVPKTAKTLLIIAFVFSTSLIPLALVYLKAFYPIYTYFSLAKIYQTPISDLVLLFFLGQTVELELSTALIYLAAPLAGVLSILYVLFTVRNRGSSSAYRKGAAFLFLGVIMFLVQHRILNLFMVNVPFPGGRLWMFRDLMVVPFVAIFVHAVTDYLQRKTSKALELTRSLLRGYSTRIGVRTLKRHTLTAGLLILYTSAFVLTSGWITISLYRSYPHYSPLQTTTYELEAARYLGQTTEQRYIVVCDQWFIFAAEMLVGINNPNAYYFDATDPDGVSLFISMKNEPSNDTLIKAMQHNNATVAYFTIQKTRMGAEMYNSIITKAQQNALQTYKVFYYPEGDEKLHVFYYRKPSPAP